MVYPQSFDLGCEVKYHGLLVKYEITKQARETRVWYIEVLGY